MNAVVLELKLVWESVSLDLKSLKHGSVYKDLIICEGIMKLWLPNFHLAVIISTVWDYHYKN